VAAAQPHEGEPAGTADAGAARAGSGAATDAAVATAAADGRPGPADVPEAGPILPERVRKVVVELAADVLGVIDADDVSPALRRVRSFAPRSRARAGASPIGLALDRDSVFRQRVAAAWRQSYPDLADAIDAGEVPPAVDPVAAAVGTFLTRPPGWPAKLAGWITTMERSAEAARREESAATASADLEAARREAERWRTAAEDAEAARAALAEELSHVRRELRRLRADADRLRAEVRGDRQRIADAEAAAAEALAERDRGVEAAERRVREAEARAEEARRGAREGRAAADTRTRLLLDTIVESAAGLRRELALPPAEGTPADAVESALAAAADATPAGVPHRARDGDDPAMLDELLRLPKAHLVVDGYNVTKTGYPALPLVDQRKRLVDGLAAVAARTSAEVTCCFDGADVTARGPSRVRGVRVLFSEPGVTADELIRRLVRAEPPGRVLVVVSSDREVVTGVVAAGARAVPAGALLRLLGRG
jgi:predicted RNA-binding protein with PIN domain